MLLSIFNDRAVRRGVLAALCLLSFCVTVVSVFEFTRSIDQADTMRANDVAARNLLITLLDAETGQRGYIITGDNRYLDPYYAGASAASKTIVELKKAGTNTEQTNRIADVERLANAKLDELAKTITIRKHSFQAAAEEVDGHLGKNLMDMVRQHLDEIELWADASYSTYEAEATGFARLAFLTMVVSLATAFYLALRRDE